MNSSDQEVPQIGRRAWFFLILAATIAGFTVHYVWVGHEYRVAVQVLLGAPFANSEALTTLNPADRADVILRYFAIDPQSGVNLKSAIAQAYDSPQTPALYLAAAVLQSRAPADGSGSNQSDATQICSDKSVRSTVATALARLLLGWPGDNSSDLSAVQQWINSDLMSRWQAAQPSCLIHNPQLKSANSYSSEATALTTLGANCCRTWVTSNTTQSTTLRGSLMNGPGSTGTWLWFGSRAKRAPPLSPADLATRLLGPGACLPGPDTGSASASQLQCQVLRGLFATALDDDSVRSARATKINFWWGWERAGVLSLAGLVFGALVILQRKRRPLTAQAAFLRGELDRCQKILSANHPPLRTAAQTPQTLIDDLQKTFYDVYGGNKAAARPFTWAPRITVLRDLVDSTQESVNATDRSHLERIVELHTTAMLRQRAFINTLITAFPALGLIATLRGLILALSHASGIVSGNETARFDATELVTATLSSSFATTLIALISMAIFMLWNMREEHADVDLIEDSNKRLLTVFWPGRK